MNLERTPPSQLSCSPRYIGIRSIDHIDIIDTVHRRAYFAESVPFPVIPPHGPHDTWTVVRGQDGHPECLTPYGNSILRFRIRNYISLDRMRPYVADQRTRRLLSDNIDTTKQVINLRHGEQFLVGFHQPFVSSYVIVSISDTDFVSSRNVISVNNGEYLQIYGSDEVDGAAITHPFTRQQWRISVSRPFLSIPLVQTLAYVLSSASIVALVFFGYRARKHRLAALSESIRQEQLALLREDMHDMIGSKLVRIASLTRQGSSSRGEDVLERIHEMTTTTIRSLRNMLSLMSDDGIADEDFFGMMREYVMGACADVNITCIVAIDVPAGTISLTNLERHELLMIITEMVTNSMRHAVCTTTSLTVKHTPDHLSIRWSDNGRGFDTQSRRGHGLNNIERRTGRLGGTVFINGVEPSGTEFHIAIPITVKG